jgi:hypothetical protein
VIGQKLSLLPLGNIIDDQNALIGLACVRELSPKNSVNLRTKRHNQITIQQPLQKASDMKVKNLDHLGLVAGLVDDLGILQKINELVGEQSGEIISIKIKKYSGSQKSEVCPMPYALCPMPMSTSSFARKAIYKIMTSSVDRLDY